MVLLAHVRSGFALSNGTYGSPRMRRELQDAGLVLQLSLQVRWRAIAASFPMADFGGGLMQASPQ
jgi:hypothetical protein